VKYDSNNWSSGEGTEYVPHAGSVPRRKPKEKLKKARFRTGVIFRINNHPLAVEIGLNLRGPLAPEAAARLEDA
jgi:hypothetical protein